MLGLRIDGAPVRKKYIQNLNKLQIASVYWIVEVSNLKEVKIYLKILLTLSMNLKKIQLTLQNVLWVN